MPRKLTRPMTLRPSIPHALALNALVQLEQSEGQRSSQTAVVEQALERDPRFRKLLALERDKFKQQASQSQR